MHVGSSNWLPYGLSRVEQVLHQMWISGNMHLVHLHQVQIRVPTLPLKPGGDSTIKACLHVPSPSPCPSPSPSKFIMVSMEMDRLMDRMGSVPFLPVKRTVTIGVMLYFDGDGDGHGDGNGTCKQALSPKQVYQWPIKRTCVHQKLKKKIYN